MKNHGHQFQQPFRIQNKGSINGISSGLLDLDSKLGGFKNSDLIILAGRPSIGKTALGVNLAINACKYFLTQKNTIVIFNEVCV